MSCSQTTSESESSSSDYIDGNNVKNQQARIQSVYETKTSTGVDRPKIQPAQSQNTCKGHPQASTPQTKQKLRVFSKNSSSNSSYTSDDEESQKPATITTVRPKGNLSSDGSEDTPPVKARQNNLPFTAPAEFSAYTAACDLLRKQQEAQFIKVAQTLAEYNKCIETSNAAVIKMHNQQVDIIASVRENEKSVLYLVEAQKKRISQMLLDIAYANKAAEENSKQISNIQKREAQYETKDTVSHLSKILEKTSTEAKQDISRLEKQLQDMTSALNSQKFDVFALQSRHKHSNDATDHHSSYYTNGTDSLQESQTTSLFEPETKHKKHKSYKIQDNVQFNDYHQEGEDNSVRGIGNAIKWLIDGFKTQQKQIDKIKSQNNSYKQQINDQQNEITILTKKIKQLQDENTQYVKEFGIYKTEQLQQLEQIIDQQNNHYDQFKKNISATQQRIDRLEIQFNEKLRETMQKIQTPTKFYKDLHRDINNQGVELNSCKNQLQQYQIRKSNVTVLNRSQNSCNQYESPQEVHKASNDAGQKQQNKQLQQNTFKNQNQKQVNTRQDLSQPLYP